MSKIYFSTVLSNQAVLKDVDLIINQNHQKAIVLHFFLRVQNDDVKVCKKYFRETFQVSDGRIHNCGIKDDVNCVKDKRGKSTPGNKVDITDVDNHIKSFPAYHSHYTRAHNPHRKHLSPDLTIKKCMICM